MLLRRPLFLFVIAFSVHRTLAIRWHTILAHAAHCCHVVMPAMLAVRHAADELEGMVADDLWPLATYQEILFIK